MATNDTVVIDGTIELLINGGSPEMSIINGTAEFGTFTAVYDYEYPVYTGEVIVTPKAFEEQVLGTQFKTVVEDITIREIPYTEVSNPSGGNTVNIG